MESSPRELISTSVEEEGKTDWTPPERNQPDIDLHQRIKLIGCNPDIYHKLLGDFLKKHSRYKDFR